MYQPYRALTVAVSAVACATMPVAAHAASVGRNAVSIEVSGHGSGVQGLQTVRKAVAWSELRQLIASWASLPDDWDGMGGVPASRAVVANAQSMIDSLQISGMSVPQADFAGDGEITLRWASGEDVATVSYLDDGHIVGIVRVSGREPYKFDQPVASFRSSELFDRLVSFS